MGSDLKILSKEGTTGRSTGTLYESNKTVGFANSENFAELGRGWRRQRSGVAESNIRPGSSDVEDGSSAASDKGLGSSGFQEEIGLSVGEGKIRMAYVLNL